jgi:hypothetical protein
MILAAVLRVPQTTFHNNNIVVVNNPIGSFVSYALPILVVTYGQPPQNYLFKSAFHGAACDRVLYHQTTLQAAQSIKQQGFDINRSNIGLVGRGAYFATHPRSTNQKAQQKGALLRATVSVGMSHHAPFAGQRDFDPQTLITQYPPLSSVRIPRNDWNHQATENGAEYVVFEASKIKRVEILSQKQCADMLNVF